MSILLKSLSVFMDKTACYYILNKNFIFIPHHSDPFQDPDNPDQCCMGCYYEFHFNDAPYIP